MDKTCTWTHNGSVNWDTECGHTYFPYIKSLNQPNIYDTDLCPWCGKKRVEIEDDENDEEDDY